MSDTIRINTTPNGSDKYVKVKLDQEFDFIEILSLKLSQEDTYRQFCSDYGVIVGRVSVNNGFGVPNAMVSVFIPLDDVDKNDSEIRGLYPYTLLSDKDENGVRYNLLPKEGGSDICTTKIGTFPTKREVLDNDQLGYVYEKYYKFTTTTNHAGDFMIFGVPLGTHTVHVDADISDIGILSQRPYDLISQGTPKEFFDSSTKFKKDKNLDRLVQVKTLNSAVNVQPFWGDVDNCEIGISRLDFDLNYSVRPTAIFMGSIFGDNEKNSISKRCRPRKLVGAMCEQTTSTGTIQMIRKSFDDTIEQFDVDGGNLIDDDGTWSYQIPMNLDYVVTNEYGDLIPSQDPNVGVPTRASVRFNIGMDDTGGDGRLRTRARYLVPNNPVGLDQIDYEFGPNTKDTSFREMYWNKIYTVSNFISRFQTSNTANNRAYTGVKDVDGCVGTKTPFPYNRVDTQGNPIFFILCLIITVLIFIITIINSAVIPVINTLISAVRIFTKKVKYIDCVNFNCNGIYYAEGCGKSTRGWDGISNSPKENSGLGNCIKYQLAESLNLFKLDFYNDWVHGSLFSFLVKYKKKTKRKNKNGEEKFCEYECYDGNFTPIDGVDANGNNFPDNKCHVNYLKDSCYGTGNDSQNGEVGLTLNEGLIKKVDGELYYAATTHNNDVKMFATDIVNLGSVLDCDWQGIPKINENLLPTTYKLAPDSEEKNDAGIVEVCGNVSLVNEGSLFFKIDCGGLHVNQQGCLNVRHLCEFGVNIDEATFDSDGNLLTPSNCVIGSSEVDDDNGKFFRDVFYGLNSSATPWIGTTELIGIGTGYSTNFNINNVSTYSFTNAVANGADYLKFRGYKENTQNQFAQTKNSYFFYFGLTPGKTALDKMNSKFFTKCPITTDSNILILTSTVNDVQETNNGSLSFSFIGGVPEYTYSVTSDAYSVTGITVNNGTVSLPNIAKGDYLITGVDALGVSVSKLVTITGKSTPIGFATATKNTSTTTSSDGQITISSVSGGVPPYTYTVLKYGAPLSSGQVLVGPLTFTAPTIISGLPYDITNGHTLKITDSANSEFFISSLKIDSNPIFTLSVLDKENPCFNDSESGYISYGISGGQPPYSISTTGPNGFLSTSTVLSFLGIGSYTTTVTDGLGAITNNVVSLVPSPEITLTLNSSLNGVVSVMVGYSFNAPTNVEIFYYDANGTEVILSSAPYVNSSTEIIFNSIAGREITVRLDNCYSNTITT